MRRIFGRLTYEVELVELGPGELLERGEYVLETFPVDHGLSALGYALVEHARPGRFDSTRPTRSGSRSGPSEARSSTATRSRSPTVA